MKKLFLVLFFSLTYIVVNCQSFEVRVDTLNLYINKIVRPNSDINVYHAVKFNGKYYCFFNEWSYNPTTYFLKISEDGTILENIEIPKDLINSLNFPFFIRNNRLIVEVFCSHLGVKNYVFNNSKWEYTEADNNIVFEDNKYIIKYLDFGEWGNTTWFIDKKTKKEYDLGFDCKKVNFLNRKYYLTGIAEIREVEDPLKLNQCDPNYYYEKVKKENIHQGSYSLSGSKVIYKDTTYSPLIFNESCLKIITSFIFKNQLFHLCSDKNSTFIAKIENGVCVPIQNIGKYSISGLNYLYEDNNLSNKNCFVKFGKNNKSFGFLEINDNKINIQYLKYNIDTLDYLGSDGFDKLIEYVSNNVNDLTSEKFDDFEKKLGGTDMRIDHIYINPFVYFPEKLKTMNVRPKMFKKIEDKIISQTTVYAYDDSVKNLKYIFIEWYLTVKFNESPSIAEFITKEKPEVNERFKRKINDIETIINNQFGKGLTNEEQNEDNIEYTWTSKNGLKVIMNNSNFNGMRKIRVFIYKE